MISEFSINSIILDNCFGYKIRKRLISVKEIDVKRKKLIDEHRGKRESRRRAHTVQEENERKGSKQNDREDSGGRGVEVSGHCQLEDP